MVYMTVRLSAASDALTGSVSARRDVRAGKDYGAAPSLTFVSYDDLHYVLAPSRIAIVIALVGQDALSIREVADRLGRDVQLVGDDVGILLNAGVIEGTASGIVFACDGLRFSFDICLNS